MSYKMCIHWNRNNFALLLSIWFGLCFCLSECTLKLDDKCGADSVDPGCPANSACTYRGCSGAICLCNEGLMPMSDSYDKCVEIAELGDKCNNTNKRCRGNSRCDTALGCICQSGYSRYGNQCIPREPLGKRKAYIGEPCNKTEDCLDKYHLDCIQSRCACGKGFKPPDQQTIDAYPFSPLVCVNANFKLGKEYDTAEECFTVDPFPPSSTNSASTETILGTTPMNSLSQTTVTSTKSNQRSSSGFSTENTITSTLQTPATSTSYDISSSTSSYSQLFNSQISSSMKLSSIDRISDNIDTTASTSFNTWFTGQVTEVSTPNTSPLTLQKSSIVVVSSSELLTTHFISSSFLEPLNSVSQTHVFPGTTEAISVLQSSSSVITKSTLEVSMSSRTISSVEFSHQSSALSSLKSTLSALAVSEYTPTSLDITLPFHATSSPSEIAVTPSVISPSEIVDTPSVISPSEIVDTPSVIFSTEASSENLFVSTKSPTTLSIDSSMQTPASISHQFSHSISLVSEIPSSTSPSPFHSTSVSTSSFSITTAYSTTSQNFNATSVPPVNSPCDLKEICPDNAECTATSCGKKCLCKSGYAPDQSNICVKVVTLGQHCGSKAVCMGPKAACIDSKCQCLHGYKPDASNTRCKKSTSWFIEFPLLMEECSIFFKECHNAFEQVCRNDKCTCREGLRKKTLVEMKESYKSYKQCVNETAVEDSLVGNNCEYYSANEDEPLIDTARKRIQIMQGVIIGGGLLVVFLIAGLITMILCIRYKRRIGDMRSETSSVVSLDRCSEGKYSFRIPRPFATPILYAGTGESDTDAVSFQNTAYDSERERLRDEEHKSINGTMARGFNLKSEDIEFKFYEEDKENKDDK